MIKKGKPEMNEIDSIFSNMQPQKSGIWILENDREMFLNYLANVTESKYVINENGYLQIENKDKQNDYDKKIEKIISGEKTYIINISSTCYIVDEISGEILDYSFENMDQFQTYEYFEDDNNMIIFITQNTNKQLEDEEIIKSVIDLL